MVAEVIVVCVGGGLWKIVGSIAITAYDQQTNTHHVGTVKQNIDSNIIKEGG